MEGGEGFFKNKTSKKNIDLPYDPAIPLLDMYSPKNQKRRHM